MIATVRRWWGALVLSVVLVACASSTPKGAPDYAERGPGPNRHGEDPGRAAPAVQPDTL